MDREDELRKAAQEYENALRTVKACTPGKPGFGIEARYGQAYQRLVRLGAGPQLKRKYRG